MSDAELVLEYLRLGTAGDVEAAAKYEHPDMTYWLSGRLIVSGDLTIAQKRKAAAGVHDAFPGGYTLHIRNVIAADGQVAVESQGDGIMADGTHYTPVYAMFFKVVDGLIVSTKEYIDTEYVGATFKLPLKSA